MDFSVLMNVLHEFKVKESSKQHCSEGIQISIQNKSPASPSGRFSIICQNDAISFYRHVTLLSFHASSFMHKFCLTVGTPAQSFKLCMEFDFLSIQWITKESWQFTQGIRLFLKFNFRFIFSYCFKILSGLSQQLCLISWLFFQLSPLKDLGENHNYDLFIFSPLWKEISYWSTC